MENTDYKSNALSSVANALKILKSFSNAKPVRRVSDLAEELDVSKSTISRLIQTLVAEGFLVRDSESAGYRLGYQILTLGGLMANTSELYREVAPVLNDIVLKTGESAHVAVLVGHDVIYLNKNKGPYYSDIDTQVGKKNPVHATSSGKILLAEADEKIIDEVFQNGVQAYTEHTILNPIKFKKILAQVREQGYALSIEEFKENNYSLAVPVRDLAGETVCALIVAGPVSRLNQNKLDKFIPLLKEAAKEASERLGYDG